MTEKFKALIKEAEFTKEVLGAGATQIRKANYTSKGTYFHAFTSLSTGLERIGKLCLMIDYYLDHNGAFPNVSYLKKQIGHDISLIYEKTASLVMKRSIQMRFLRELDGSIHQNILAILSKFALGDRYSNIDLLSGNDRQGDSIASWFNRVDKPLLENCVAKKKRDSIAERARIIAPIISQFSMVMHISETGEIVTDFETASKMTGLFEAVAPYRQLYVVQIIRYWVEILISLQYAAMNAGQNDIPYFSEIFALFYNPDSYIKSRKTWDRLWH